MSRPWMRRALLLLALSLVTPALLRADIIQTAVGGGPYPSGAPALGAPLGAPHSVAAAPNGDLFVAAGYLHRILKVSAGGVITVVAGTGSPASSGDGGPAIAAALNNPDGVFRDPNGNLFVSDLGNRRVRRIDAATGTIATVAGGGLNSVGDGGPATSAILDPAGAVAVDPAGNILIADVNSARIRRVDAATGIISSVAGGVLVGFGGDGFPATGAQLYNPTSVVLDAAGNFYFSDSGNNRVRKVTAATGIIDTVAGGAPCCDLGDGGPATAAILRAPAGIALDSSGNLFIADSIDRRVRRVDHATGIITTFAGTGTLGFAGDGGPAGSALLSSLFGVAVDASDSLLIADTGNNRVRRTDPAGASIATVAGNGLLSATGDGGQAAQSGLGALGGIATDAAGNLFIADVDNNDVRRVDGATGIITTFAGNGTAGFAGDGGPAVSASLRAPKGVGLDAAGNLFIADTGNSRIRRVDASTGVITTIAGTGVNSFTGDGGPATAATFRSPTSVVVNAVGDIFISDRINRRVRRVDGVTGIITTYAGDGTSTGGDATGKAINASIPEPVGVALDGAGNLFIADRAGTRIRRVDGNSGNIRTVAGGGSSSGEGVPATAVELWEPTGIVADAAGNILYADEQGQHVRRVDAAGGTISTVAGIPTLSCCPVPGFGGDGGPALQAHMNHPFGVALTPTGDVLIADSLNRRVRAAGVPACFDFDGDGAGVPGNVACPRGLVPDCDDT
ncbi:MAG: hypothetical protein HY049_06010, partial [Acidobacteria bacterium]|nr:hypothetical protein [Acidobacteriota bacterium]